MHDLLHTLNANMFQLPVPWLEKVLRPVLMYIVLVVLLRLFGKRELAQLNPFDLVVLLTLSNTVQNAIIGNDNSWSGGVIGAVALLGINWLVSKLLFRAPRINQALEGKATVLIRNGKVDDAALEQETLTMEELISVLNKNGFDNPWDVELCVLEPNGTFFVKGKQLTSDDLLRGEILKRLGELTDEVRALKAERNSSTGS